MAAAASKRRYIDASEEDEEVPKAPVGASPAGPSRYARSDAVTSLRDLSVGQSRAMAVSGMAKLQARKRLVYPEDLTAALVERWPQLQQFVCWGCEPGDGVSVSTSGGKYNVAQYIKVSCGKSLKPQGHKLALCVKENILYTELEPRGFETSHLCHSTLGCWRTEHLAAETHATNVARNHGRGCAGWLFFVTGARLVCFCRHAPPCMFVRVFATDAGVLETTTLLGGAGRAEPDSR